ncbi:MAG: hypothetical protein OSA97_05765, partial [Nevskia sp.]|nr:hypothetical protein [Nevskia sp.]
MAGPQEEPEGEPRRSHGVSPVVERRPRSALSLVAGAVVILLVVGFLFASGAKNSKPKPAPKAPAIASSPGLPPAAPASPPLPPLSPEEAAAGFPPPPVPGQGAKGEAAESAHQKEDARVRSPMLIYDASDHEEAPPAVKQNAPDPLAALLANQLRGANAPKAQEPADRASPAEGYAERTQAFAKAASERGPEAATAHRISMGDRIAEGKMLAATLETAIDSDLPGRLRAIVTTDVWSEDGSRHLIRKGSRLIGDYRSGLVRGQTRVFVIWTRLLQPDVGAVG